MPVNVRRLWLGVTAALTVILLIIVYPLLEAKFGAVRAILLSALLVTGMLLYHLRGMILSRPEK